MDTNTAHVAALQEVAASVGLGLADSPAQVVAAVAGLKAERDELRAWKTAIEAQEPVMWQARFDEGGWQYCVKNHYDAVVADPSRWNKRRKYEVRALFTRPVQTQATPTGPRQAVLLSDAEIQQARSTAVNNAPGDILMGRVAGLGYAELHELSRAIEAATLKKNGLEVRRG